MISMQRSLSSPVSIHSSNPASTLGSSTHISKSPTPPPESRLDPSRSRRVPSRSPTRAADDTSSLPLRRSEDGGRRVSLLPSSSSGGAWKPIIMQSATPLPPTLSGPESNQEPPPASAPEKPHASRSNSILPDLSLYTNPDFIPESDSTTLDELAHVVRLSRYQERKRANTRIRLQRSLISTALSARFTRCGELAHRNLVDCFRTDDKKTFASLYNAIHDVRKSCDELRRYALLEPEMDDLHSPVLESSENMAAEVNPAFGALGSIAPFLNDISASARESFLTFLTQIRTNPDYLAARLCSLTSLELTALTTFHQVLEPIESVLPYQSRMTGRTQGNMSSKSSAQIPHTIERRLLSFQRHDPLSALIHTCFANSAGPDSLEDRRRTDIWATACARLISESRSGLEPFIISVLSAWASMRDWSGKSNMEWYLMKILEDGAFLLDRAEDQHGTRFNISDWTQKDNIAAEEFYERAVNELFDIVDDEDATGIPEGFLELGDEILKRLDSKFVDNTRKFLVCKWLFQHFLLGVIIHPESHGLMTEYHITEYGRQKILKQVALKAMQFVVDMTPWNKKPATAPPKIKAHIENIMNRFRGTGSQTPTSKLLPARSITSLRETLEVHPYLVISPSDLLTLVNALFPEHRPQSRASSSLRSGAASVSGLSALSQPLARLNLDTASVVSNSASSTVSDTIPIEEQQTGSSRRYSPPVHDAAAQKRSSNYVDDGYRLRLALHEMTQSLGLDVVQGSCHPCAERWAVLFIAAEGTALSMQMTYDPDDEVDEDENSSLTDTDEDDADEGPELDKEYHQLRDSILKLVEDYEIPWSAEQPGTKSHLSNRASGLKKYRSKNKVTTTEKAMPNRNPYRRRAQRKESQGGEPHPPAAPTTSQDAAEGDRTTSVLIAMLTAASAQSRAQSDFVSAHLYWKTLQQLNTLTSPSLRRNGFAVLLNIFSRGPKDSIRRSASAIEEYDAWLVWLKQSQERHEGLIDRMVKRLRALRDKMWYVTDVRNSGPYEYSRNICVALKTMGMPQKWGAYQRSRGGTTRGPASSYIYRQESQIMELLAASDEQGGPNKLSDDQAEKTLRWLDQYGVEQFCKGEERIHRFCLEVDNCIGKLIGESLIDSPVLWSSELYSRDRKLLETSKQGRDRDSLWGGDDPSSVITDPERRFGHSVRPIHPIRDLRSMSAHNASQHSLDPSRFGFSRASTALSEILDSQDYFGVSSPVHTIDSTTTFWSPFQPTVSASSATSRAHSPTTSLTNVSSTFSYPYHQHLPSQTSHSTGRPGTATSSNETIYQQRLTEEKTKFLGDLRQTLTSLLLSDLGNLVFARGSETDGWFDDLGQQCIDRKEALDRKAWRAANPRKEKPSPKPRVIEKKKSFGNLRGAGESSTDRGSDGTETPTGLGHDGSNKGNTPEFPFKSAYRRLLRMFCVHPNPFVKLNALHELKHLIIAALTSGGGRRKGQGWARSAEEQNISRPKPLDDAIDTLKERRSNSMLQPSFSSPTTGSGHAPRQPGADTRSLASVGPASTEAITNMLLSLFRDCSIRPKTLFRDLQFIAAFVPPAILDKSDKGVSFWDTGLAALALKQEVCQTMVQIAFDIVDFYTRTRKKSNDAKVGESDPPSSTTPPPAAAKYSLSDAGRMFVLLAKEGVPMAQRELAIFYLSNAELIERTTLPLSKPREVFKQTVMEKYGGGTARGGVGARHPADRYRGGNGAGLLGAGLGGSAAHPGQDAEAEDENVRGNPALMCVALHWMEAAEQSGDEMATTFLRQQEFTGFG